MNLKYDKIGNQARGVNNDSTSDATTFKKKMQSLKELKNKEIYFNDRTGLSFLNKDFPSDQYHYLWLKDDFITHPATNFNPEKNERMNKKEKYTIKNEILGDHENPSLSQLANHKFTNENLNPATTNYDLIRFNDNNFKVLNQDEFIITIPIITTPDTNDSVDLNQKNNLSREDISNKKQFLLIKPSSAFVAISYQMNFTPIIPINFVTSQLRKDMVQHINQQFYTSSEEFLTFSRKFNRIDHQNTLTLKDFISFPSIMFVFALKLYNIAPSPKGFALLRLLLMVHIKKQTFLNPKFNNKDFNFFVNAFDDIFTNIKEIWGNYYDQSITQQCYIIHPQFFYKKSHQDLYRIFLDKRYTRKSLSIQSFVNILFGEEIIKPFNKDKKNDTNNSYDQNHSQVIDIVEDIKQQQIGIESIEYSRMNDRKSLFKYFSTLYTNQCIANYLVHRHPSYLSRFINSSKNKTKTKNKKKGKNRYGNNPLIYYQGIYLFLSRKVKKLFVIDKDKKANYFLIDDIFRATDPYGPEEEEIEKEGLDEELKEGTKNSCFKKAKILSKSLQVGVFRPFIIDIFNIHCLCSFCCPTLTDREREKYSNPSEPDHYNSSRRNVNQFRHRICVYQILKILLSMSLASSSFSSSSSSTSVDYFLMEKYNNKIENLYIQNEPTTSTSPPTTTSTSATHHHDHSHHYYDKKWQKLIKEKGIEQFFSHPQLYNMNAREEEAIRASLVFFRKYETAILDRLKNESDIPTSSNKNSSSQSQNSLSSSSSSSSSTQGSPSISNKPNRFICRVEKYNKRLSSFDKSNEDINFAKLFAIFNKNRSDYRCTCYEYLYNSGHYLCRHIIAGQLNSIYESHNEKEKYSVIGTTSDVYRYRSTTANPRTKKISLLEMKRRKYTAFPFLKQLELQLLNIIKKEKVK